MKKVLIFISILFISAYPQSLKSKIDTVLKDKFFESCLVAIQVEDLTANKTVYKKNEKYLLRPASNMKILTSAAGLQYLGPDYEFKTDVYYDGYVSNDTLFGNIFVVGGCDPDFVTQNLYPFVDAIKALNINFIKGNLFADVSFKDSLFWGHGWMWDDDPSSDAPHLNALNINDNCVEVFVQTSEYLDKPTITLSPNTKYLTVRNESSFNGAEKFQITRNWIEKKNEIIVKGKFPISNRYVKQLVNVIDPAKYFLTVFVEVLDSNRVKLLGKVELQNLSGDETLLYSFTRKYSDIIDNLNKESDNLSSEMTLYALSEKYSGRPATADSGVQFIKMMIDSIGLNSADYRIVDGSGVSHYNVVSAELLTNTLKYFYDKKPELYKILYKSFPIAGVDGTLENRMRKTVAANNVHAKTGTLTGVSCISGYVTTQRNHTLAFSIMMQNFVGSSSKAREFQDVICKILAESK
jgi:D-alanyl-D-alanine carboxypeptidase/D-alanyl-D-alanine-endopeptidase (penicillin-binding protein 4)